MNTKRLGLGLFLVATIAGCNRGGSSAEPTTTIPSSTSTSVSPVSSTSSSTTVAKSTTTVAEPGGLAEGRSFGFITSFGPGRTAQFDLASFLTGAAADKAAAEDGVITPGQHVDNDYYIRNTNPKLRTITFSPSASIKLVDCNSGCKPAPSTLEKLRARPTPLPVWITIKQRIVVKVEEQYRP